jgi:hypothetical protein
MPSRSRSVSFEASPVYSRQPFDDEKYVMKAFNRHCTRCAQCSNPYAVHKAGGTLCDKGHRRALDVAQYVYSQAGVSYSQVDRECHERVQLEIPVGCEAVRSLLKAMERGLRLVRSQHAQLPSRESSVLSDASSRSDSSSSRSSSSSSRSSPSRGAGPLSYDRTYYVAPRVPASKPEKRDSHKSDRRPERREKAEEKPRRRHHKSSSNDYEHENSWPRNTVRRDRASTYAQPSHSDYKYYNYDTPAGYYSFPTYEAPRSGLISVW